MKKLSETKRRILYLSFIALFGVFYTVAYLIFFGNANQVYNDIITEWTSEVSGNKSAERNLIYILCFLGITIYTLLCIISNKFRGTAESGFKEESFLTYQREKEFLFALISTAAVYLIITGGTNSVVIAGLIYAAVLYIIDRSLMLHGICVYFLSIYSYIALYRIYVLVGGDNSGNIMTAVLAALSISSASLIFSNKKRFLLRIGLLESIIIPFLLLIYLADRYQYGEMIIVINGSNTARKLVLILIATFSTMALWTAVKRWKNVDSIDEVIRAGTCISIMAFNRFEGSGAIMSTDMHHPFENIIGYSQVFKLGQTPFKNYIPVSGMYSVIQGAIFDCFGDGGTFANYFITDNVFYLLVIILIVALLTKHIDRPYVLLISLILLIPEYNRYTFVLPVALLLAWPKLVDRKNLWLMVWFVTSLLHGLYYPVYGVAVCLGFLPLGLWQFATYIRSLELQRTVCTVRFWIGWCVVLGVSVLCGGFLLGTFRHISAMSSQSILADGICRFGQLLPSWFFPYLSYDDPTVRLALYYSFTFVIPFLFVLTAYAVALKQADCIGRRRERKVENLKEACIFISIAIILLVSYSYTVIRLDPYGIYVRNNGVLYASMVLLITFSFYYLKAGKLRLLLVLFAIAISTVESGVGIFHAETKMHAAYTVPENFIYVNDADNKLGEGFIHQDIYNALKEINERFAKKSSEQSFYGDPSTLGYYYLLDIKGDVAMEMGTVRGFDAAQEAVNILRENGTVAGMPDSFINYYLYYWLLASGEYFWDEEAAEFIPNDGRYTREEIAEQNKNNETSTRWDGRDIGKNAASWGLSMDTLEALFAEPEIEYEAKRNGNSYIIGFEEPLDGDRADFIYLEFADMDQDCNYTLYDTSGETVQEVHGLARLFMKKNYNPGMSVCVRWQDENGEAHALWCRMSQGKLLIPAGSGAKWLFNKHDYVSVHAYQDGTEIEVPELLEARFLKIREVE